MDTVLVVGGAGYIGSHTTLALREAGVRVVVYDDLSAGHREAVLGAPLVEADVHDVDTLRRTLREHEVGAVLHFAGRLSVPESVTDPAGYYRHNVVGTLSLLEAMVAESVDALVFSSTAAVYGEPDRSPILEEHPTRPVNTYGETKLAVERALPHFERAHGLRSVCLRYFNASGADPAGRLGEAHDPETHLIPRALIAASGGPALEIFGDDYATPDGSCLRDFVHVTDLADAHVLACEYLLQGGRSDLFNVGTGTPHSVRDVVDAVGRVTGREVLVRASPRRAGDPAVLVAGSTKVQRALRWRPKHSTLTDIVETAWRWHQTGWSRDERRDKC